MGEFFDISEDSTMKIVKRRASAKVDGGLDFILSDATPDRLGDIIDPKGWDLSEFHRNPIALFNHRGGEPIGEWENVKVESGALRGRLKMAEAGTSARIDELRSLVAQGILRAASVGFSPIEYETFKNGDETGIHFRRQKLLETSLVSIPANPAALAVVKSLSAETRDLVFGKLADTDQADRQRLIVGKLAANILPKGKPMTMQKRIEDAQARLVQLKDQLVEHMKTYDPATTDEAHVAAQDELNNQIELAQKSLDSLKRSESMLAVSSEIVVSRATPPARATIPATAARPAPSSQELMLRSAAAVLISKLRGDVTPMQVLAERYGADGKVDDLSAMALRGFHRPEGIHFADALVPFQRTASIPADTTTSGWVSQLAEATSAPFMDLLYPASVWPGLSSRGLRMSFGRNGTVNIPARVSTPTIAGAFVGQGSPIPVKQGAVTSTPLTPKKMAVISTWTREAQMHTNPQIEGLIRQWIQEDTSAALDAVLLDATAASALRPAGIRNGVSVTTATAGGGFTALIGDLKALVAALITGTAGNIRTPVWIMNPIQQLAISLTQNAGGEFPFAAEINQNRFQGMPVIVSSTVTAGMVILVDAADFVALEGDAPSFSVSDQATLHMEDTTPLPIATGAQGPGVLATPTRSLYQTDSMALRMIMDINWAFRRTGGVAWTQAVTW